mgnify:CR=1 FL=1
MMLIINATESATEQGPECRENLKSKEIAGTFSHGTVFPGFTVPGVPGVRKKINKSTQ